MAEFNLGRAIADAGSYNPDTRGRAERNLSAEFRRLEADVRRLEGLLAASQARDEVATELLRGEVRRTVTAEAERDRWRLEAERLAATVVPESPISDSGDDRG